MKNIFLLLSLISISMHSQFTNVLISNALSPKEPTISINPNDTNKLFAAANLRNYYVSIDGGITWTANTTTTQYGVWGDFCSLIGKNGAFYMFHLSYPNASTTDSNDWLDRIVCQKSTDDGATFPDVTYFGLNADPLKDQDKEWAFQDPDNGNIYVTWSEFDSYGSSNASCKSRILFVKSTDNAQTWSTPVKINEIDGNCVDEDLTVEGAVPAVGPNGEIYVTWAGPNGIVFNKSTDFGVTWNTTDTLVDSMPNGWDFSVPGIDRCNGLPITLCDTSGGVNNGTIYVNWSDQRNGANDTDVWVKKSTDGGTTWGSPIRVNDDVAGKHQFFTWMDIDQTNGNLYCVFYDRRNHNDNMTDVYLARSIDGGLTWQNILISETSFLPTSNVFFGDYNGISAHNGVIRPIWKRLHNGNASVWTALINDNDIVAVDDYFNTDFELEQNYPNPAKDETYIAFKLKNADKVTLTIYNILGEKVSKVIDNTLYESGYYVQKIALEDYQLTEGVYFYDLKIGKKVKTKKMIVE
ncbi:MAG: T9SS type A sorting domain-containing protein [Flavobacteriaceae bacterium]